MAENKKSFLLYADLIHTVRKMPKDKAGELLLTILQYVNDENPKVEDMLVDIVFEPIKQQMKRDLQKWDTKKEKLSAAGKASAEAKKAAKEYQQNTTPVNKRQHKSTNVKSVQPGSTDSTVNDTVNVNVTVIKEEEVVDAQEEILEPEIEKIEIPVYVPKNQLSEDEKNAAVEFLKSTRMFRSLQEKQKLSEKEVLKLFDAFIDQKLDLGQLQGKSQKEIIDNFYWWVPKHLIANKSNSNSNANSNTRTTGNRAVSSSPDSKRADRHETLGKLRGLLQGTQPKQ